MGTPPCYPVKKTLITVAYLMPKKRCAGSYGPMVGGVDCASQMAPSSKTLFRKAAHPLSDGGKHMDKVTTIAWPVEQVAEAIQAIATRRGWISLSGSDNKPGQAPSDDARLAEWLEVIARSMGVD